MRSTTFQKLAAVAALLALPAMASAQSHAAPAAAAKTIPQVAIDAGNFTTLVAALDAAGLVETLNGPGPFTVFAPSDAAFAKLPAGTVESLLADRAKLTSVLTFHVLSGRVMAADVLKMNGARAATVNGQQLGIAIRDGKVYVNGAQVVTTDIVASNGVIHVIDAVLLPAATPARR